MNFGTNWVNVSLYSQNGTHCSVHAHTSLGLLDIILHWQRGNNYASHALIHSTFPASAYHVPRVVILEVSSYPECSLCFPRAKPNTPDVYSLVNCACIGGDPPHCYLGWYTRSCRNLWYCIDGFQMSIKRPISGGQTRNQEAAVQRTFHLERSSFFYLSLLMVRTRCSTY